MAANNTGNGIFTAWSPLQVLGFWIILALTVSGAVFLAVPLGLTFFLLVFFLPMVWKDPDDVENPTRGQMIRGTTPYKIATFIKTMKKGKGGQRSHIFSPINLLGFGPPEDDINKGLSASTFSPPGRMAAYWALGFAFCLSYLDRLVYPWVYPVRNKGIDYPVIVSQVVSVIFFFMAFQALNTARRYQLGSAMMGVTHTPAVMINKIPRNTLIKSTLIGNGVVGLATTAATLGIVYLLSSSIKEIVWGEVWMWAVMFGVSVGIFYQFRMMTKEYRKDFDFQVSRREFWSNVYAFQGMKEPFFEMEVPVPGEPGKPGGPPEGEEPGEPHVWAATFSYPTNGNYSVYHADAPLISPSLPNGEMVAITPIPKKDPTTGRTIPGTVSDDGFRVWWSDQNIPLSLLLTSPDITPEQKGVAVSATILEPLAGIKGIGRCIMHSYSSMTAPESKVNIMKLVVVPPNGVVEKSFMDKIPQIESALGVKWVRVDSSIDRNGRKVIELYIGNGGPNSPDIVYPKGMAASRFRKKLITVDWRYNFHVNKISSPNGSPELILSKAATERSDELVFDIPAGVSYNIIKKNADNLKTTSGNTYIELHEGITGKKDFTSGESKEVDRFMKNKGSNAQFTAIVAPQHPLDEMFLFSNYKDRLISGREKGVAKISWSPGVRSNGSLAKHSFASDMAHLIVAGSSGSGKSVLIYSMLCQLIANNNPEDVQIWLVDPKVGFKYFQFVDNVTRYVDSWTPSEDFFGNVRDLLHDAVEEMKRRNRIFRFSDSEDPIDKLAVARKEGIKQGPLPDGSPNPLINPYIIIVIDEVAMLFADAPDKESKELQVEILYYASKLARESRSAGIHCLFATQYPTKQSLPPLIKQQSGRIGLQTQDAVASKVIIDQPGLEEPHLKAIKGSGKVLEKGTFYDFRGFLLEDDSSDEHSMMDIINSAPRRDYDPDIDGDVVADGASTSSGSTYMDIPDPEATIFHDWDSGAGKSGSKKAYESGKADKVKSLLDGLENMSDAEFEALTLDDFRSMVDSLE